MRATGGAGPNNPRQKLYRHPPRQRLGIVLLWGLAMREVIAELEVSVSLAIKTTSEN